MMQSKPFAHPLNLRLLGLPLILFLGVLLLDVIHSLGRSPFFAAGAAWLAGLGLLVALLNAAVGLRQMRLLPVKMHTRYLARLYGTLNLLLALLFGLSVALRYLGNDSAPGNLLPVLSYVGILLGILTLWLGGEIVYGVDRLTQPRRADFELPTTPSRRPTLGPHSA